MKIIGTGDLHFISQRPRNRTDDYIQTQTEKLLYVMNYARSLREKEIFICFPGDVFNSPDAPYSLYQHWAQFLKGNPLVTIFVVFGQHDLRYRTAKENTPLYALHSSGFVHILDESPVHVKRSPIEKDYMNVSFYGASFGAPVPKIQEPKHFNVLVIHEMIIDEKLWDGQEEYTLASRLLREHKYNLIISGDNHSFFTQEHRGKVLINCGSLMRSTIAQVDHKPQFISFDVDSGEYLIESIPIKPIEEVMNLDIARKEKEKDEKIEAFVDGLEEDVEIELDFQRDIESYMEANKIEKDTRNIVRECMEEE